MLGLVNLCPAVFPGTKSKILLSQSTLLTFLMDICIPKMCLIILLSATTIREFLGLWFQVMNFVHDCQNFMSLCMSTRFEFKHTILPLYM
jgi:hypothetical protein